MYTVKYIFWYIIKEFIAIVLFIPSLIYLKLKYRKDKVLVVLNYHNFSKYNNYKIFRGDILKTGYSKSFERQIRFLKNNFNFVYPDEFFNDQCKKGINVLITFDDGYKDNYDLAFPILQKYKAKCIFFIVTDYIDTNKWLWHDQVRILIQKDKIKSDESEQLLKQMNRGVVILDSFYNKIESLFKKESMQRRMMNWDEVLEIYNSGFEVGAHTSTHKILSFLTLEEQEKEIGNSLKKLSKKINNEARTFAYPNGQYNKTSLDWLQKMKIDIAFTTNPGLNKQTQNKQQLKRIGINASDSISVLILKLFMHVNK